MKHLGRYRCKDLLGGAGAEFARISADEGQRPKACGEACRNKGEASKSRVCRGFRWKVIVGR